MVQGIYLNTSRNLKRLALAHSIEKKLVHVVTSLNKQGATTRPRFILTLSTSHPRFWTLAANLPSIRRAKRFCALSRSHQQHHFIWIWRTILSCRCHGCKWLLTSMKWEVASAKPFFLKQCSNHPNLGAKLENISQIQSLSCMLGAAPWHAWSRFYQILSTCYACHLPKANTTSKGKKFRGKLNASMMFSHTACKTAYLLSGGVEWLAQFIFLASYTRSQG